jgi:2-polyprenyl-3-methyl-5-hydroxy-6-metoxy-1,4-benzoquinol methylase
MARLTPGLIPKSSALTISARRWRSGHAPPGRSDCILPRLTGPAEAYLPDAMTRTLRLYADQPPGIRLFVRLRHLLAPLERIADRVPSCGRILDVGCGHGLFGNLLAQQSPARVVEGVDPSAAKVAVARRAGRSLPNVRFWRGTIEDVRGSGYDAITVLDVLYLLPPECKREFLLRCRALLGPRGVLLLKTNDTAPRWKYAVTHTQERLMTRLGLTSGDALHFFSQAQHLTLLGEVGFNVRAERLDGWWPYPHMLFECRPRGDPA